MIGSTIASFPNRVYICGNCGKHLGDRYSRLKGKKSPSVFIIDGGTYCSRCADKKINADRWHIWGDWRIIMAMKKKTSIMLSARDKRLLELLAKKENRSQTKELEYLIRRRAEELELKIEEHNYYKKTEKHS